MVIWIQILPKLHTVVHPYNQHLQKKKFRRKPFNDILSEAVQIAGIENDQEYGLDDLPDLLDTHGRKLKSFIWIG